MYLIIGLMFAGILIGLTIISRQKDQKIIKIVGHIQAGATIILLFIIGAWLGGNDAFWLDLKNTGLAGILFAVCTIGGSVLVVYLLARLFMKGESK